MQKSLDCVQARKALVTQAIADGPECAFDQEITAHLETCPDCRVFADGLVLTKHLFCFKSPLYNPSLRVRTLQALSEREDARNFKLFFWLVPCATLGLFVGIVGPFLLLSRMIQVFVTSPMVVTLISVATLSTIVVLATGVFLTLFWRTRHDEVGVADFEGRVLEV